MNRSLAGLATLVLLTACAGLPRADRSSSMDVSAQRITEHRGDDDLLTAGLGIDGLRQPIAPAFAAPDAPTAAELRRRAIWTNWRGIADLVPGGGFGDWYGSVAAVPGREFSAFARLPGATQPHRVMVQLPDAFDAARRCVVVTASSGSRGVYGAISVAGAWGLPKGCAVAYTDKGAGTDYFDLDAGQGPSPDGTVTAAADVALAFAPDAPTGPAGVRGVAFKHAHSGDNPEADWGRHVRQAADYALQVLNQARPGDAPFTHANTRIIAVGISNGGGAVLRAAEAGEGWLDAVVAGEPNVYADAPGARTLYDVTTEAALLMPCALLHVQGLPQPPVTAQAAPAWTQRCASLAADGVIAGADTAAQARSAHDALRAGGWTDDALRAGALSVGFDLWRAVAATYASAYARTGVDAHPCGFGFAMLGAGGKPRVATPAERAAWWSDGSGIPPGNGIGLIDPQLAGADPTYPGLRCLRGLATGRDGLAARVQQGAAATRASAPAKGLPVVVIHGLDDGLVPAAFTSAPYVAMARAAGRDVRHWQVRRAQHFDAFLALPDYRSRYVPLLPYVFAALDRVQAHLDDGAPLPADALVEPTPRPMGTALDAASLALPVR